jgi:hypothetical protein
MSGGPVPYQLSRLVPAKYYVCELHGATSPHTNPLCDRRLAGPFDSELEALAAAGAIEAEHPKYRARTEVWRSDVADIDGFPSAITIPLSASQIALKL